MLRTEWCSSDARAWLPIYLSATSFIPLGVRTPDPYAFPRYETKSTQSLLLRRAGNALVSAHIFCLISARMFCARRATRVSRSILAHPRLDRRNYRRNTHLLVQAKFSGAI